MIDPDISPDFVWHAEDARIAAQLVDREATPQAIRFFARHHRHLSDYGYWFLLGSLWVSYSGWSDLALWRRLLCSDRPHRDTSLMKPSEMQVFRALPETLTVYRAHRPSETDWIAYTLDRRVAERLATERRGPIRTYQVAKADVVALFLRRGEQEVLVLDPRSAAPVPAHG